MHDQNLIRLRHIKKITGTLKIQTSRNSMFAITYFAGSSSGIGAGAAVEFAKHGAKVSITGRDKSRLEGIAKKCVEAGLTEEDVRRIIYRYTLL